MKYTGQVMLFILFFFVLLSSLTFAVTMQSGDGGTAFANNTAAVKCQEPDTQAVYWCSGNVVRVVSTVPGEGSTFYKPDGKIVKCPVVTPSQMGAECLQMMTPNYCPTQAQCGNSPAPEVFPGQNDTPEQTGNLSYYIVPGEAAADNVTSTVPEQPPIQPVKKNTTNQKPAVEENQLEIPAPVKTNVDSPLGYLLYVVGFLGICAVGILFLLFRNSLTEEEDEY